MSGEAPARPSHGVAYSHGATYATLLLSFAFDHPELLEHPDRGLEVAVQVGERVHLVGGA